MSAAKNFFDFEKRLSLGEAGNVTSVVNTYVWGNTVVKVGSTYHCYIATWTNVDGLDGYAYYGKIYHASSSNALGPFSTMTELTELDGQTWCAGAKVNPKAIIFEDTIYLYFTGTTVETPSYPVTGTPARANQRIGVATTPISSPAGPFTLYSGNPILAPRSGEWDEIFVNNPAPYIARDKSWRMIYKSCTNAAPSTLKLGVATAPVDSPLGPWTNAPAVINNTNQEDPDVWVEGEFYYLLAKAQDSAVVPIGNGISYYSRAGDNWAQISDKTRGWRLNSPNSSFVTSLRGRMERPFVLVEGGKAIGFFQAILSQDTLTGINLGRAVRP